MCALRGDDDESIRNACTRRANTRDDGWRGITSKLAAGKASGGDSAFV